MERIILLILGLTFINSSIFSQENRTFDGSGNNLQNPEWGAAHTQLKRVTTISYEDGIASPAGVNRPNPRTISNTLFAQDSLVNDPLNLSDFVWVFGQFIDHDISLTGNSSENAFVQVPQGDPWFDPFGQGTALIFMNRSKAMDGTGTDASNPREHGNEITAWLDASNVYGSDQERADWLRTFSNGKMKVSTANLLPFNTFTGNYATPVDYDSPLMDDAVQISNYHFVAGDARANENPLLTSFHTLFVREHNRLCDTLLVQNPTWSDEEIYQHTRKTVGGLIQNIVYEEWLPVMGVDLSPYAGYDSSVDPRILNVFSAAAFRMGHTLLNSTLLRLDNDGNEIPAGNLQLQEAFFNPISMIWTGGGIDPLFKGMGTQVEQNLDCKVIDDVRNFLFGPPGAGGLDLASININRGRERGLPDFNTIRTDFGMPAYSNFYELNPDSSIAQSMQQLYGDINDVDAWVGMLAENHMPDALFGETIMKIMELQFQALRDGDRFYFENDSALSADEIDEIKNTTLHDIIMRNTNITLMQPNVFEAMPHGDICNPIASSLVTGIISNEFGEEIEFVNVLLENGNSMLTNTLGNYDLAAENCIEQTISLDRTDNPANGVTALDIIMIRSHILNLNMLTSPYEMIAADVNQSKEITTFDMVQMQQVILGLIPEFPNSPSWLFFEEGFTFDDPTNPFTTVLPDNVYSFSSDSDTLNLNFMGLKIGDVNDSANPNFDSDNSDTRNENTLILAAENQEIEAGEIVDIYLNTTEVINLEAFQFTLNFENDALQFVDLKSATISEFSKFNYAAFENEGAITVSYAHGFSLEKNNSMLHFTFQALRDGNLKELLHLDSRITKAEAYSSSYEALDINLTFEGENVNALLSSQLKLYQNQPNPFQESTHINFYLPVASDVELRIFDLSGRVLTTVSRNFSKGNQMIEIDERDFKESGVFYYQLLTDYGTLTKKMVRIN